MRRRNLLMAAAAAVTTAALLAPPAVADPAGLPQFRDLVGVGNDTTQDLMNALSNVPPSGSRTISSFNATGVSPLPATKAPVPGSDCTGILRPANSSDGLTVLRNEIGVAAGTGRRPCLDFARSNVALSGDPANAGLKFLPFAAEAVSYVTRRDSALPSNLTKTQLASIYRCQASGTISIPPTILPLLPPEGSATRAFFLAQIEVPSSPVLPCWQTTDPTTPGSPLPENNGSRLTDPRMLVPHSVAAFYAQYYKQVNDVRSTTELRKVNGFTPAEPSFPFKRPVYNVVETARLGDPAVSSVFVGSDDPTDICNQPDLIVRWGFTLLPAGTCGL